MSLRVSFITEAHFPVIGGKEVATHSLAGTLNKRPGVRISLACAAMRGIPNDFNYDYPAYVAKSFWRFTPWLYERNIIRMISREKPDILHGFVSHTIGLSAVAAADRYKLPVVVQSHGSDVYSVPEIGYGAVLEPKIRRIIKSTLSRADHILAVSTQNKKMLMAMGAPEQKITVIPNGIAYDQIQQIPERDMRPELSLKPEDFVLVTVGGNRRVKRLSLLFEAIALLKSDYRDIKCVCVGAREGLSELADKYGVADRVILVGKIPHRIRRDAKPPFEELVNLYRSCDLYISTSYVESFGIAALEALACGKPVLVGCRHGVRDVIQTGRTGFVMEKETPEELADLILYIRSQRGEYRELSAEISVSVSWLTWDYVADQYLKVCHSLAGCTQSLKPVGGTRGAK